MEKIRVVIVEDDINFLKAMTIFINNQQDMLVISSAASKEQAVELAKVAEFDVILMDINLNENMRDGILAALEIKQFSSSKIIMLTSLSAEDIILDSFTAGAINYISKQKYKEIPDAFRATYYDANPYEVVLKNYSELKKEEQLKELPKSQRRVYDLIEQGYTKKAIETILHISENTVKFAVKGMLKTLAVRNSKEAVEKVKRLGIKYQ